jgi:hypothetical protein
LRTWYATVMRPLLVSLECIIPFRRNHSENHLGTYLPPARAIAEIYLRKGGVGVKQRPMLVVMLALVALSCVVSWGVRAQSSSKVTWEYKVLSTYGPSITNPPPNVHELDEAGAKGWELVAIRSGEFPTVRSNQFRTDYFLKRAK